MMMPLTHSEAEETNFHIIPETSAYKIKNIASLYLLFFNLIFGWDGGAIEFDEENCSHAMMFHVLLIV